MNKYEEVVVDGKKMLIVTEIDPEIIDNNINFKELEKKNNETSKD